MSSEFFRKCCKCAAIPLHDETISYHRFPKPGKTNILRARAWAVYCWPEKDWTSLHSLKELHNSHKMLCGRHFEESCFLDSSKRRLSKFSVPGSSDYIKDLMNKLRNGGSLKNTPTEMIESSTIPLEPVAGSSGYTPYQEKTPVHPTMEETKVSHDQKTMLLEFMMRHTDLGRGRLTGPDASRKKMDLLEELAALLNASESGATKTPEKWWKCWQDWRSDTKGKAMRLKRHTAGSGGGPGPAPLSALEQSLLQFCGLEIDVAPGGESSPEPLEKSLETDHYTHQSTDTDPEPEPVLSDSPISRPETVIEDPMHACLERQTVALESLATAMHDIAAAMSQIARAGQGLHDIADAIRKMAEK